MNKKTEQYIRAKFAEGVLKLDPYPHLVIDNILPPELYQCIERDIPSVARWYYSAIRSTFMRQLTEARQRWPQYRWLLVPGAIARTIGNLLPGQSAVGQRLAQPALDCVDPQYATYGMARASAEWRKYAPTIQFVNEQVQALFAKSAETYMAQLVSAGIYPDPQPQKALVHEFCHRIRGWTIDPHIHDIGQAIQWMIYFPLPGSIDDQGTIFHRLVKKKTIPGDKLHRGTIWFSSDEVEHAFTVPYRANTLVAFLNTPSTIHSTIEIPGMVARRYFFVCNWWASDPKPVDINVSPGGAFSSVMR